MEPKTFPGRKWLGPLGPQKCSFIRGAIIFHIKVLRSTDYPPFDPVPRVKPSEASRAAGGEALGLRKKKKDLVASCQPLVSYTRD